MRRKSPFWLIALLLLGLAALVPLLHASPPAADPAQSGQRGSGTNPQNAAPPAPTRTANAAASPLPADLEIKRLMLRDGSFQSISKYEVKGDRVRYLSAERSEWEEIPSSLVDWPATEKYAREHISGSLSRNAAEADAEEQAERKREAELTPEVAPGLRLPRQGGVFLLEVYDQQAQLCELAQNSGEVKRNTGRNILRATINPLAGAKQTIELPGAHAQVQSHVNNPFLYVSVDEDPDAPGSSAPGQASKDRFRIVRVESDKKKNSRVVGAIKVAMYGKVSQQQKFVPVKAEQFSGPWVKLTPAEPLPPGEYALVELLGDKQEMNLYVWDFGFNAEAPANPNAWRAEPATTNR
jgi:hypothetical protein